MVLDFDFEFLAEATGLFDSQIARLVLEATDIVDSDAAGLLDRIDYVCGLGFAACQQYLVAVCEGFAVPSAALDRGPRHRSGPSVASIVNAAGNYWKRAAVWPSPSDERAKEAMHVLETIGIRLDCPYVLANALHALASDSASPFARIVEYLIQWQRDL